MTGEVLIIHNVTRFCGDKYECVAFNGVPPAVNKLIEVSVECKLGWFPIVVLCLITFFFMNVIKSEMLECGELP